MKNIPIISIIIICTQLYFAQTLEMPNIEVEPIYKGEYRIPTASTRYYSSHYAGGKVVGYDYQIKIRLLFSENYQMTDSLYGIVCILPSYETRKLSFKSDKIIQISPGEYEYSFKLRIKEKGWLKIFISQKKDFLKDTDPIFYKNTSNKVSHYLDNS